MQTVIEYCRKYPDVFNFEDSDIQNEELEQYLYEFIIKYFDQSIHAKELIDIRNIRWLDDNIRNKIYSIYKAYRKYYSKSYTNENGNKLKFSTYLSKMG
jgi:hypothetical protein